MQINGYVNVSFKIIITIGSAINISINENQQNYL